MKIINTDKIELNTEYEEGFHIRVGVSESTCGAQKITSGRTYLPPSGRNQAHYHENAEAVMYIMRGKIRITSGQGDSEKEYIVGPGEFIYVPPMEVHGIVNCSNDEPAEWIFIYSGASTLEGAGTVFV